MSDKQKKERNHSMEWTSSRYESWCSTALEIWWTMSPDGFAQMQSMICFQLQIEHIFVSKFFFSWIIFMCKKEWNDQPKKYFSGIKLNWHKPKQIWKRKK